MMGLVLLLPASTTALLVSGSGSLLLLWIQVHHRWERRKAIMARYDPACRSGARN